MLGVDPGMQNVHGTQPVDVVTQLYRDDELGALMITRISLDNQLISGVAIHRWLEQNLPSLRLSMLILNWKTHLSQMAWIQKELKRIKPE